jgi:tail tube protein
MFASPVATVDSPFSVVDATIRLGGVDLVELTSFDLTLDISPSAPATFGSGGQKFSPDVFTAPLQVSMNIAALRKDLARLADFIAETRYTLHVLAVDNTAEPKDFLSITVPNFTLGSVDPSAFTKQGGPRTQTIAIPAGLVGVATDAANGFDPTMISFQTTAA